MTKTAKTAIAMTARELLATKPKRRVTKALVVLEETGFENILDRIRSGQSMREIAEALGIHVATLSRFLHGPERDAETRSAMAASAESWGDRALEALAWAKGKDAAAGAWARTYEQHCRWRAAIRNPAFNEKSSVELSGPGGAPIATATQNIVFYIPENHRDEGIVSDNGA